ncbi:hypothetical protein [Sulfurimonas hydrogeniphila]|uniref:hypothetical protein n=1 Tax=Sulfurimonas hydrogeniphila TaxID=2509341 RepID=UPI00125EFBFF|nr:hypothetical protein [Sulfurimonas hydrogeniphila]
MKTNEKKQITDILNAFRLINKDIRKAFNIMSERLESKNDFEQWKKWEKGNKNAKEDYADYTSFFDGEDWYYLNCYGLYKEKVVGFTFVISVCYDEEDVDYANFLKLLDANINLNTPLLCILGVYSPIDSQNIKLDDSDGNHYVDEILQFTEGWSNYKKDAIEYDKWLDIEIDCFDDKQVKKGYEGWYKQAKIKLVHITDIFSKGKAENYIDDLIKTV